MPCWDDPLPSLKLRLCVLWSEDTPCPREEMSLSLKPNEKMWLQNLRNFWNYANSASNLLWLEFSHHIKSTSTDSREVKKTARAASVHKWFCQDRWDWLELIPRTHPSEKEKIVWITDTTPSSKCQQIWACKGLWSADHGELNWYLLTLLFHLKLAFFFSCWTWGIWDSILGLDSSTGELGNSGLGLPSKSDPTGMIFFLCPLGVS